MIRKLSFFVLPLMAGTAACAFSPAPEATPDAGSSRIAKAVIATADGKVLGEACLQGDEQGLRLEVQVEGMAEGTNGMHLHAIGLCEAPGFTSAGGHLNPGNREHGMHNPRGSHLGDLPNLVIGADGRASETIPLHGTRAELEAALFDADGTSIVIHAAPDDLVTDPTGNSGARIACGVLVRG